MNFIDDISEDNKLYLLLAEASELKKKNIEIAEAVTERGYSTIVITSNQPYSILKKKYEKRGIPLENLYFIDAITRYALGKTPEKSNNCTFINRPGNLTDLGIAITEMLDVLDDKKTCIIFDSISTMLIYIPSKNLSKFIHFLTNKLRLLEADGIFLAVEKGLDPELLTVLTTFVDTVIDNDG